jgi:hypothetical protein
MNILCQADIPTLMNILCQADILWPVLVEIGVNVVI